jgi:hypothetical protein
LQAFIRIRRACFRPIEFLGTDVFEAGQQAEAEEVAEGKSNFALPMSVCYL